MGWRSPEAVDEILTNDCEVTHSEISIVTLHKGNCKQMHMMVYCKTPKGTVSVFHHKEMIEEILF